MLAFLLEILLGAAGSIALGAVIMIAIGRAANHLAD